MAALAQPAVSADSVIKEATTGILLDKEAKALGAQALERLDQDRTETRGTVTVILAGLSTALRGSSAHFCNMIDTCKWSPTEVLSNSTSSQILHQSSSNYFASSETSSAKRLFAKVLPDEAVMVAWHLMLFMFGI